MEYRSAFPGRVIFDHLPKSAGQAVNAWLRMTLGPACVTTNLIGSHRELIRQYGGDYSIISAHIKFSGEGLDPRYQYVACLREPIDRALSWLFFVIKNHQEAELSKSWAAAKDYINVDSVWADVMSFVESEGEIIRNGVGFNTIGHHIVNPYVEHFAAIEGSTLGLSDAEKIEKALVAINQFAVWGVYEQLPIFLADFSALLGMPAPDAIDRVNVTRDRPSVNVISAKLRERLEILNSLDLKFYKILTDQYNDARRQWLRPAVTSPTWGYVDHPKDRFFSVDEFVLVNVALGGDRSLPVGGLLHFHIDISLSIRLAELEICINLFDAYGRKAFGTNSKLLDQSINQLEVGSYRLHLSMVVNLPEGDYSAGLVFFECGNGIRRELAGYNNILSFVVNLSRTTDTTGYAILPTTLYCLQISDRPTQRIHDASGSIRCVRPFSGNLTVDELFNIPVILTNSSIQDWANIWLHSINLSYRWLDDSGNIVVLDGIRTPLPNGELSASAHTAITVMVKAPSQPGRYQLCVLPVQEGICWFDSFGFVPLIFSVDVATIGMARHYFVTDGRLYSLVGVINDKDGCLASTEIAGYLLYGPYSRVAAGSWRSKICGQFDPKFGGMIRAEVVTDQSTRKLAEVILDQGCDTICIDFCLESEAADLEVRVWVDERAIAKIYQLVIEPVQRTDDTLEMVRATAQAVTSCLVGTKGTVGTSDRKIAKSGNSRRNK